MKILVTGGAGYIGSHTVAQLCADGYDVAVLDNLSTSCEESIVRLRKITGKEIPLYKVDIRDTENVRKVLRDEKIEAIIHFAAYSLVGESMTNPLKYYENNLYGTKQLLQAMVEEKVDKIVFSSMAATYGEPKSIIVFDKLKEFFEKSFAFSRKCSFYFIVKSQFLLARFFRQHYVFAMNVAVVKFPYNGFHINLPKTVNRPVAPLS